MSITKIKKEIRSRGNKKRAKASVWFFKTGKGQYGEGDKFVGCTVPELRKIAVKNSEVNLSDVKKLLESKIHEDRFVALEILREKFYKSEDNKIKKEIFNFYLKNTKYVNNWDLVDTSAPYIVGRYLLDKDKKILTTLAKSKNLWKKRIAIVSTWTFINNRKTSETFKISKILLNDDHDLIHKAVGWMLREAGKKNLKDLEKFLKQNYKTMPRTMLRYTIERFPESRRQKYLKGKI